MRKKMEKEMKKSSAIDEAFKTIKNNTDSFNRPRQFRSILSNKAPIGHNIRLDLVSNNKVVNNDFEKFFKQKAYAPLTIDTSKF